METTVEERPAACRVLRVLGIGILLGACQGEELPAARDVLLITIDTLRADHLSIYGYGRETSPGIDRWFEEGAVYLRAHSTEASTSPSVVSILSGKLPQEHGVRLFFQLLPAGLELLPDLLPAEYQTAAVVSNMVLTDEATGLAAHFDHFDDRVSQRESKRKFYERDAQRTTDDALAWLLAEADPERPLFLWVHYIDPHGPYAPPESAAVRFAHEGRHEIPADQVIPRYGMLDGVTDGLEYVDRYDAEIAFADGEVDRLIAGFARLRAIDDTLVVLTSDHGESMLEHERWFAHSYHVYEEIAHVPLLLRGPGVEQGRFGELVSGLDITPTILRFSGSIPDAALVGLDLRSGSSHPAGRTVFVEASRKERQWRAALRGDDKWMVEVLGPERKTGERVRFDLASDPGELERLAWEGLPEPAAMLLEFVSSDPDPAGIPDEYVGGMRLDAPKVRPGLTDDQLDALRSLGYVDSE